MVTKSATSWIESDPRGTLSTRASFQVTGDALVPAMLTDILKVNPTTAYAKGEVYFAGQRTGNVAGHTGLWLISTRPEFSTTLDDHLKFLAAYTFRNVPNIVEFLAFVERRELKAEFHLFWHGRASALWPEPTPQLVKLSEFLSAPLIKDFDREDVDAGEPAMWARTHRIPVVGVA